MIHSFAVSLSVRFPRPCLVLTLGFLVAPVVAEGGAQTETFVVPPEVSAMLDSIKSTAADTVDPDWNHFNLRFAETDLGALVPNDLSGDPDRVQTMLKMGKTLFPLTVQASTAQIGTWYDNGTLVAVEYAVMDGDPIPLPLATEHLGVVGVIEGTDSAGAPVSLGQMFCFSQAQYDARVLSIETILARPLDQHLVWLGPVAHAAASDKPIQVFGRQHEFSGLLEAPATIRIGGQSQNILDGAASPVPLDIHGSGHGPIEYFQRPAAPLPSPRHDAAWYQASAVANGTYFDDDITIIRDLTGAIVTSLGQPISNVVYATGSIILDSDLIVGDFTFISEDEIRIAGNHCALEGAVDDLFAWSLVDGLDGIVVSGDENSITGALYSESSAVSIVGGMNALTGKCVADRVTVAGSVNVISDGTR